MRETITACNVYLKSKAESKSEPVPELLTSVAAYLTKMLRIFGVIQPGSEIGFPSSSSDGDDASGAFVDREKLLLPYVECLAGFREDVRTKALGVKATDILKLCDQLRDVSLPDLGVRLEDHGGAFSR